MNDEQRKEETAREARRRIKSEMLHKAGTVVENLWPDEQDSERDERLHAEVLRELSEEFYRRARRLAE